MNKVELSLAIANYFIQKANDECISMTPMKVLKLVYISHGWHLAFYSSPLIEEEVLAWKYGPVIHSVYREFKIYGDTNINDTGFFFNHKMEMVTPIPEKGKWAFLDRVWEVYKKFNGIELSALTHETGTPWDTVWNVRKGKDIKNAVIPNEVIKTYYDKKAQASKRSLDA